MFFDDVRVPHFYDRMRSRVRIFFVLDAGVAPMGEPARVRCAPMVG